MVKHLQGTALQAQALLEHEGVVLSNLARQARREGKKLAAGEYLRQRDYYWALSEKLGNVRKQYRVESEWWDDGRYVKADPMYFVDYNAALMYYNAEKEAIREYADCGYCTLFCERYVGRKKYDCIN